MSRYACMEEDVPAPREIAVRVAFDNAEDNARKTCPFWVNDRLRYTCCMHNRITMACYRRREFHRRAERMLHYMETGQ